MSTEISFLGGQNILDGMPLRRAGMILFAIEARTAQMVAQSRIVLAPYATHKTAAEKEQAFLSAVAQGRELPSQPTIQDIERFAPEWSSLVPSDEDQRAALAKRISEKFHFRYRDVPELRVALGLETHGVQQSYERLFQKAIDSIYVYDIPFPEKMRWLSSRFTNRLERLPPFWIAYSLSLTETIGGSILALPIALAGVGPIPGVILLLAFGLVNLFTLMGIVEAITRNGNMRYGTAYFGRLVEDYLGKNGGYFLIPVFLIINFTYLIAIYIGISISVADITHMSPLFWAGVVFVVTVLILRRESLNATVAFALTIGFINILILLVLSALALGKMDMSNLQYVSRLTDGKLFNPGLIELIFGVVLYAYCGHVSAASAAKIVLRRDPGGRSLIRGNMAAMITIIALYILWEIAINGVISPAELGGLTGTVLAPLAEKIGGIVPILGIVYIVLGMGIGVILTSYALYYQLREILPSNTTKTTQFVVSLLPLVLLFLIVEWMLFTGGQSFSKLLGIPGTVLIPLLTGIFPILMLIASRRKGDYIPQYKFRFMSNPFLLAAVYLIFLGSIFFYGFFIWDGLFERIMAISVGLITLGFTYLVAKQGAFTSRAVIELMIDLSDDSERATLTMIDQGRPLPGELKLVYINKEEVLKGSEFTIPAYKKLKKMVFILPVITSQEIKIWLHCVTPDGNSETFPALLKLRTDGGPDVIKFEGNTDQIIRPLQDKTLELEIDLL